VSPLAAGAGPVDVYVYYRVDPRALAAAEMGIPQAMREIEAHTGVRGEWMARLDDPDTRMEVYRGVRDPAGFREVLADCAARAGLDRLLADGAARHVEIFRTLA
jgi:hypothetical protein